MDQERIKKISAFGLQMITRFEGFRLAPYHDTNGYWTCGYGHKMNRDPNAGEIWTHAQATDQLEIDVMEASRGIASAITVPLSQPQYDAVCSLVYNIGSGHFDGSTVQKRINQHRMNDAADAFLLWADHGRADERRAFERAVFIYGSILE